MNKKLRYIILIGLAIISLLLIYLDHSKLKYQNIFEEIYHDEYSHATNSWEPNASTLQLLPNMEKKSTYGLLFGTIVETYAESSLPNDVNSINYTFNYPDEKIEKGNVSIFINLNLSNSDILQVEYFYKHNSCLLIRKMKVFSEFFDNEYPFGEYNSQNKSEVESLLKVADNLLKNKIIADWLSIYPSQYSIENWGEVQIINHNLSD